MLTALCPQNVHGARFNTTLYALDLQPESSFAGDKPTPWGTQYKAWVPNKLRLKLDDRAAESSCVQSGDGLSLCFRGPQVAATAAGGRLLSSPTAAAAGFSLLVHSSDAQPALDAANNLLENANFTLADTDDNAHGLPADWTACGPGEYGRTTDPAHTRPVKPSPLVQFFPVSQYLLELASGVCVIEIWVLKAHRIRV